MSDRLLKLITMGISVFVSMAVITIIFELLGNRNDALEATCIAMLCSSLSLDIYPRLTSRFSEPKSLDT